MARICFVRLGATPLFHDSDEIFGGAEVRAVTFAEGLADLTGHEVSFAMREAEGLPAYSPTGRVRLYGLPRRLGTWTKFYSSMIRRLARNPAAYRPIEDVDADVFACFGVHAPTAGIVEAAKRSGRRSLLFLASAEAVEDLGSCTPRQLRHRRMYEYAIRNADRIIAQTTFQQRQILTRYHCPSTLIRNPIEIPNRPLAPSTRDHVLWIGRADRDSKRADLCIEIAKRCPEIPFTLVMNETSEDVYRELTSALTENIRLLPRVPLSQTGELFNSASVLINTSESEGFPNTFLQAATQGVPIVSLRVDPDEMLTRHGCGVVAGNLAAMCDLTRRVHVGELPFSPAASRRYVETYHELTARIGELDQLISKLLRPKMAA